MVPHRVTSILAFLTFCSSAYSDRTGAQATGLHNDSDLPPKPLSALQDQILPSLGDNHITCNPPSYLGPEVELWDCLGAIYKTSQEPIRDYLLPKYWKTPEFEGQGRNVPVWWKAGGCFMLIGSPMKRDREAFNLIAASYYASLVVETCLLIQKTSKGGRFSMESGKFYVDIVGSIASHIGDDGNVAVVKTE